MKKLAIIIPAYKPRFLQETLDSIAKQNNHEFTVYIGDDASPYPLETIVDRYKNKFDIIYHRFEQNMGKKDLPGHWERCILLSAEELIWLFSDDDLMPFDGVARIIRASQKHSEGKYIFRFPLEVVDEYGKLKYKNPPFKTDLTSGYEFLLDKLSGKISSAACEYVFSRTVWEQTGGFIKFPLAWCTDDATWAKFAEFTGGIISLPGNPVSWRNAEGENISNSTHFNKEKIRATILFMEWISINYHSHLHERKFKKAIKRYIYKLLQHSLKNDFSLHDLLLLCNALRKLTLNVSLLVLVHHVGKKIKRQLTRNK